MKTVKVSELTGAALDWVVARTMPDGAWWRSAEFLCSFQPSTDWADGGPIIEREGISVIRIDDEDIPDAEGFWTGKKVSRWGAVICDRHGLEENHGPQGDYWGMAYHVDANAVYGPAPLIAAMRCYVASKMGDTIEVPTELL